MMLAQQLYEGIELPGPGRRRRRRPHYLHANRLGPGVRRSALGAVRESHHDAFRRRVTCRSGRTSTRSKADAQDAHEAIRPTSMQYDPETVRPYLTPDQFSLYRLIWNRFVASQMMPATFDETTVDITAADYLFRVKGTVPKFAGWMATYGPAGRDGIASRLDAARSGSAPSKSRRGRRGGGVRRPAAARRRRSARAEAAAPRTEVHAAASALHGSDARQGARGERHRPPEHLRLDHRRASGPRLRQQARGTLQADGARPDDLATC